MVDFSDQVAVVTGRAHGVRRAVVDRLIQQGAPVAVWDVDPDALAAIQKAHRDVILPLSVNVAGKDSVARDLTQVLGWAAALRDIVCLCVTAAATSIRISHQTSGAHIASMLSKIPRGRFSHVEEAAAMISWLVSRESAFSTSDVFDLSGGRATY